MAATRSRAGFGAPWLALVVAVLAGLASGCEEGGGDGPPPPPSPAEDGAVAAAASAPAPPRELDLATRRALRIAPRATSPQRLAVARRRVAVLTADALVVKDADTLEELVRAPLEGPRAVVSLGDGSILGIGASAATRVMPHDRVARAAPRLTVLPGARLLPDLHEPERVWSLAARGATLFRFDLAAARSQVGSTVPVPDWVNLDGFDGRALGQLADGSFLYTTGAGLSQFWGTSRKRPVAAEVAGLLSIEPASRTDTAWLVAAGSARLCRILGGKLHALGEVRFAHAPFAVRAAGELLAVLELEQPRDAPWQFQLEVFDVKGRLRVHEHLPADESLGPDWAERLEQDRQLAVSASPPVVVVGGPGALVVRAVPEPAGHPGGASDFTGLPRSGKVGRDAERQ